MKQPLARAGARHKANRDQLAGYLLAAPTTRRAIDESGLPLLAVRPVFQ